MPPQPPGENPLPGKAAPPPSGPGPAPSPLRPASQRSQPLALPSCHGDQRGRAQGSKAPVDWLRGRVQSAGGVFRRCQDGGQVNTAWGNPGVGVAARGGGERRGVFGSAVGLAGGWRDGRCRLRSPTLAWSGVALRVASSGAGCPRLAGLPPSPSGLFSPSSIPPGGRRSSPVPGLAHQAGGGEGRR